MNKIRIFLLAIIILTSCHDREKKDKDTPRDKFVIPELFLKEDLAHEVDEWITFVGTKLDSLHADEFCYIIEFYPNNNPTSGIDTLIELSYYATTQDYSKLKGVASIGNYYVGIIDENNLGSKYYDSQLLKPISIDSFKSGPKLISGFIMVRLLRIEKGLIFKKGSII